MIDLSAAVKDNEAVILERQTVIDSLNAELLGVRDDLKTAEAHMAELESTNQLLKVKKIVVNALPSLLVPERVAWIYYSHDLMS